MFCREENEEGVGDLGGSAEGEARRQSRHRDI